MSGTSPSLAAGCLLGIDHVQVAVPTNSESACRAFYVELLGCEELAKPPLLAARGGIWVRAGANELHCGVEPEFRPARKAHPAFRVHALDALAQRLEAAAHPITWDDTNTAVRRFFAHDPFGNRLEFVDAGDSDFDRSTEPESMRKSIPQHYAAEQIIRRLEDAERRLAELERQACLPKGNRLAQRRAGA
jgi:catechol 2,3-dioxygenase-like lactoylglutathione lyase family enzyme